MVGGNLILTYQNIIKAGNMWETLYLTNLFPPLVIQYWVALDGVNLEQGTVITYIKTSTKSQPANQEAAKLALPQTLTPLLGLACPGSQPVWKF